MQALRRAGEEVVIVEGVEDPAVLSTTTDTFLFLFVYWTVGQESLILPAGCWTSGAG